VEYKMMEAMERMSFIFKGIGVVVVVGLVVLSGTLLG
jgi:hypothetical protein